MGERLIIHANTLNTKTRFVCIRGGNVLGTNGSVIHVFKKQIQEKGKIGITDLKYDTILFNHRRGNKVSYLKQHLKA